MENKNSLKVGVSDFIALANQTLEYAYPSIEIEGEVGSFKVNQGKFVFFDLKDTRGSISCFMMLWQLRTPIEDGMQVVVTASPKVTPWGKFSVTVRSIRPSGEGSLKKSFELLRRTLEKEGLFSVDRKRALPRQPQHIAIISSTQAAGYTDFIKIINDRWGGLQIDVGHVQVQGSEAPDQIIRALRYFNAQERIPEVLVIIRGGGSSDDLSAFNDELLVREIAVSRIPTLVGVGHEMDVSLADMVADVRAATPSNAAQLVVPDRYEIIRGVRQQVQGLLPRVERMVETTHSDVRRRLENVVNSIEQQLSQADYKVIMLRRVLSELDPKRILERGYALIRGDAIVGAMIEIEKNDMKIIAEVSHVTKK